VKKAVYRVVYRAYGSKNNIPLWLVCKKKTNLFSKEKWPIINNDHIHCGRLPEKS